MRNRAVAASPCSPPFQNANNSPAAPSGRRAAVVAAALVVIVLCLPRSQGQTAASTSPADGFNKKWVLVWHDEFNGPNGAPPDANKWFVETGGNGWGNDELESYTSRAQNIRQEDGHLVIEAIEERFAGPDGIRRNYTSGRLITRGRFSQQYGRFEARIKNPSGRGLWPAFWLLGDDFSEAGWPACGEIDIMEQFGTADLGIRGSLHGPGYSGPDALTSSYRLPQGDFSDAFHVFALEWESDSLRFYVDGHLYAARTPSDLPAGARWVFDHKFFLIMNLGLRGNGQRSMPQSTVFPQRMLVDYVRVYSRK
jgi:beta-glucanase (GH16 family)